jgi:hypothetical protein
MHRNERRAWTYNELLLSPHRRQQERLGNGEAERLGALEVDELDAPIDYRFTSNAPCVIWQFP